MSKKPTPKPMSARAYQKALADLQLTVAGKATARALGLGVRHLQRISSGETKVPRPVEILLDMYREFGIPERILHPEDQ